MTAPYHDMVIEVVPSKFGYVVRAICNGGASVVSETRVYANLGAATDAAKKMAHWLRGATLRVGTVV